VPGTQDDIHPLRVAFHVPGTQDDSDRRRVSFPVPGTRDDTGGNHPSRARRGLRTGGANPAGRGQ